MHFLEHRVPPPLVGLIVGFGMWLFARLHQVTGVPGSLRLVLAASFCAVGFGIMFTGVASFRRSQTTISPVKPESATSLVSEGIYSLTRNPMYLGMLTVLLGWAVYLSSPLALIGLLAFWWYITRFQIIPEERALEALFGKQFSDYAAKVRRWL